MGDDLKPCPFCGVSNTHMASGWLDGRYSEEEWFQVECQECCAAGPSKPFKYQAAEAWDNAGAAAARAEAAERELAQARADARMLAVAAHGLDDCCWIDQMQAAGLTEAEVDALDALYDRLYDRPDAEVVAAIRRALGGAA